MESEVDDSGIVEVPKGVRTICPRSAAQDGGAAQDVRSKPERHRKGMHINDATMQTCQIVCCITKPSRWAHELVPYGAIFNERENTYEISNGHVILIRVIHGKHMLRVTSLDPWAISCAPIRTVHW